MEDIYIEAMKNELDSEVCNKDQWLKDSYTLCSKLSKDIESLSECSESTHYLGIFQAFTNISQRIQALSTMLTLPDFAIAFAESIKSMNNSLLVLSIQPLKLKDILIKS